MEVPADLTVDLGCYGSPADVVATARSAEEVGADGVMVSEASHDPFVTLSAVAAATERVALGTSVAIALARTPMTLAYAAHDLQALAHGRLLLGLGTQIAPHVTRRYGMPWSRPVARMREYLAAVDAIWDSWETGGRLDFRGDFYEHTLMAPAFVPEPHGHRRPPVWLAGVGPAMVSLAAEAADGLVVHPLTSLGYLDDVLLPAVGAASRIDRDEPFTVSAMVMVASGDTEEEVHRAASMSRLQIAFYASTPAYLPVLAHAGMEELHHEARRVVGEGGFLELADLVDDAVLDTFAVVGDTASVARTLQERYAGRVDRVTMTMPFQGTGAGLPVLAARCGAPR